MSGITLTNAVRANLNTLTATADMMSQVQNKLATGKKVNSALDNPNSFFTAKGLENRASDLGTLLDDMGQGVQTLKAADKGISAISDLVDAAKAKANQALQTSDQTLRSKYANEYNELLTQMQDLAKDSGYKGKNLLAGTGNDLSVTFNEDGTSSMSISAVDYTDVSTSLGLNNITAGANGTGSVEVAADAAADTTTLVTLAAFDDGDTITVTGGDGSTIGTFSVSATTTVADFNTALNAMDGVSSTYDQADGDLDITAQGQQVTITSSDGGVGQMFQAGTNSGFTNDTAINTQLSALKSAQDSLRAQASTFGTNLSIVENRQDFTTSLINTLQEGAGELTLADTNVEGANLLALQTQQQLASTSLSMASQASQNVLRLF
ncbi:flagellin [Labrenzia sp. PHM005]|uniref:flagellin N-terminal helical domain-containing protein n=1 Tax=Labrenzia sp. PHM005 TaxID=2590016 RepID=UPI0011400392|nr:flagellin [Labrenzia sp. PHM005]QDG76806.1 flagellin [Labrenzia sp. PHM005]